MSEQINLADVKCGDRFWECAEGKNLELEAMADAFQVGDLVQCQARAVATNEPVALRLDVTAPWFGPRLYRTPQYATAPLAYPERAEGLRLTPPAHRVYVADGIVDAPERQAGRLLDEYGTGLREGLLAFQTRMLKEDIARAIRQAQAQAELDNRELQRENRPLRAALAVLAEERGGRIVIAQLHLDEADELEPITTEPSDEQAHYGPDVVFQVKVAGDA